MNELIALALRRAGVNTLAEFQALQGLPPNRRGRSGDPAGPGAVSTGFPHHPDSARRYLLGAGCRYGTTSQAIATANPSLDPERLPVGAPMRVPWASLWSQPMCP